MSDIHPPPGPPPGDNPFNIEAALPEMAGACDAAVSKAYAEPGMPTPIASSGEHYV